MVKVKLDQLADRLGKSITDIARETGLNRNSVTALYHQKVDGIKFETLEKICNTYGVAIPDLMEIKTEQVKPTGKNQLYRQEAEVTGLTIIIPGLAVYSQDTKFIPKQLGDLHMYIRKEYCFAYWDLDGMRVAAQGVYDKYKASPEKLRKFYHAYLNAAQQIERLYADVTEEYVLSLSQAQLLDLYNQYTQYLIDFWNLSLFIDTFDAGVDQAEIGRIATELKLNQQEVGELTSPTELTFGNERLLSLLTLAKQLQKKNISQAQLPQIVKAFVHNSPDVQAYRKEFDYYKSNYAKINHISEDEMEAELLKFLKDEELLNQTYDQLSTFHETQTKKIQRVLDARKLTSNPLFFFQQLTYWREHRKKVNLKGFHVLDRLLTPIEQSTGISKSLLRCLTHEELSHVLKGLITQEQLKHRFEAGVMISVLKSGYTLIEGEQATSLKEELEGRLRGQMQSGVIKGQVACQGYAKGIARIILSTEDFSRFNEGEILITGMTRPEFLPLMKKAAGIVTNEGGITCHAAIVSRELGKPCIIGTQQATQLIKDGQLVEVRANHGTVRIL